MRKQIEKDHADHWYKGKSKDVIFYDTPYIRHILRDILNCVYSHLGDLTGKQCLIYGSGVNLEPAREMIKRGAQKVFMIDISPEAITFVRRKINFDGLSSHVQAEVMDCEQTEYPEGFFDAVYGKAILHHLNLEICIAELKRITRQGARMVFIEPLGTNPLIKIFRFLTPDRRTPTERPFVTVDLEKIADGGFTKCMFIPFSLFVNMGIPAHVLLNIDRGSEKTYRLLKALDE